MNELFRVYLGMNFRPLIFIILTLVGCRPDNKTKESILLYCAAGTKPVIEKVAKQYFKEFGVRIDIQYGGSGTLLSNLRIAKQGDLYISADKSYMDEAIGFGLIEETQPLAYIKPVIAVAKGNPKKIRTIEHLYKDTVAIAIANPDAASIGRLTKKMLLESGDWEAINNNITVLMPTVSDIANSIKIGTVDAGIIWDATANQYDEIDMVSVELFESHIKNITMGVLKFSKQPTEALRFLRYLSAEDKGLPHFDALGYQPIKGDVWHKEPELLFYSGSVNRLVVDKTIEMFENREGVSVTRVYNGCGILVSQIKSGQTPDAYLTSDTSFMTPVAENFHEIENISNTKIVIATKKGNPKKIRTVSDLSKTGLQLGICNHQQSALGSFTKSLLEKKGVWGAVYKNVRSQAPTADLLVNQIRTGSLDAVIVYEANIAGLRDQLDVVFIDLNLASVIQNFGLSAVSRHKFLTRRLFYALTHADSKKNYLENGFGWEYSN
jgi:molybdenum ABC transporter molybdate-binding protein